MTGRRHEPSLYDKDYTITMRLHIRNIQKEDFTSYKCVSKNNLGETDGLIQVNGESMMPSCSRRKWRLQSVRRYPPRGCGSRATAGSRTARAWGIDVEFTTTPYPPSARRREGVRLTVRTHYWQLTNFWRPFTEIPQPSAPVGTTRTPHSTHRKGNVTDPSSQFCSYLLPIEFQS